MRNNERKREVMNKVDLTRAKAIIRSTQKIAVQHQGNPVWIERVTDADNIQVNYLGTTNRLKVAVTELVEGS